MIVGAVVGIVAAMEEAAMMTEMREAIAVVETAIAISAEMRDPRAVPSSAAMPAATAHVSATKMAAADMAATAMTAAAAAAAATVTAADLNHQAVRS